MKQNLYPAILLLACLAAVADSVRGSSPLKLGLSHVPESFRNCQFGRIEFVIEIGVNLPYNIASRGYGKPAAAAS